MRFEIKRRLKYYFGVTLFMLGLILSENAFVLSLDNVTNNTYESCRPLVIINGSNHDISVGGSYTNGLMSAFAPFIIKALAEPYVWTLPTPGCKCDNLIIYDTVSTTRVFSASVASGDLVIINGSGIVKNVLTNDADVPSLDTRGKFKIKPSECTP